MSTAKKAIVWNEVRARLDAARVAAERAWTPDAATTASILEARAIALAKKPSAPSTAGALEVVELVLANETYAIESSFIRDIAPLTQLTPLPCTPDFVAGIVNRRGEILSVIDIRKFFDLPVTGLPDLNRLITLHGEGMTFGILADAILGVRRIPLSEIQPSLPTLSGIRKKYLKGISHDRTVVLDAGKLLMDIEIVVHEQIKN